VKVIVDREKCQGLGRCYDLAPDVFASDEDGYVELQLTGDIPEALQHQARVAVLNCPESALSIIE
jgi:ferredoxin